VALIRQYFVANLNVNGTGAVIASPGACPALDKACDGGCPGGYAFHWTRDGALSMLALQRLAGSRLASAGGGVPVSALSAHTLVQAYMRWVAARQAAMARGEVDQAEPKWNISTGEPYAGGWCRPQTDGPALRAQALMAAGEGAVAPAELAQIWALARFDLDWLANGTSNIERESCDVWEENSDKDFVWNRASMRSALLLGQAFAKRMGDQQRAATYQRVAESYVKDPFAEHLEGRAGGCFLAECPPRGQGPTCKKKGKAVDGAVIVALSHAGRLALRTSSPTSPALQTSEAVARTVQTYNEAFCRLYPANQQDTTDGVPGVLYGRYVKDRYGGDGKGNPWHLITASLASVLYQAGLVVGRGGNLTQEELRAWQDAVASWQFNGSAASFVAAGDAVLLRIAHHVRAEDEWHLYEQIDKVTGRQYNAKDLTWSYAEVLDALQDRDGAWPAPSVAPPGGCPVGGCQVAVEPSLRCADAVWPEGAAGGRGFFGLGKMAALLAVAAGCACVAAVCMRAGSDSSSDSEGARGSSASDSESSGSVELCARRG